MLRTFVSFAQCVLLCAAQASAQWAAAQGFPNHPLHLFTGYPPGGSADFLSRVAADELQKELGVPVVVENKPGAGGNIAAEIVAKSPPDGYTLLNATDKAVNLALYRNPGYSDKDFAGVTRVARGPCVIVVNNDSPFRSLRDVIDHARANPGKLFNASAGYGSAPHLASVLFESVAGVKFTSVQFKGGGPATQSLIAGDTQINFATPPTVMGFVRAGRVRALAVTQPKPSPAVPGVPGAEEAGLAGYNFTFSFGLYVPAGTPRDIVHRLHAAAFKGLTKNEVRDKIAVQGMEALPSQTPEAFDAEIAAEAPHWSKLVRDSGAKVE
ncbi:MAG: tripartite tricarboxylate transporter substrate binding protein [Betaproteobacteria bacterium]|nr:tripartite tricarboxylate transporter substrate binding protein [Betaproteobacteria bacterium]